MTTDNGLQLRTIDDVERVARISTASGICRVTRPEEAAVILLTGRELGLSPMQSLRGIYVVNKAPVLSADLLVAVVRRSGLCGSWRVVESTPERCTITTTRIGETEPASRTWTMADAKRAQITGKPIWSQYPAQMLRHRCAADLAREVYPDVVLGLYTPEEMDSVDRREPPPPDSRDLAPLGIEAPARVVVAQPVEAAPAALTTPGLSDAEFAAMLSMLSACETLEALDATRAEIRPDVSARATATQRAHLRAAAEARRAALTPTEPTPPTPPRGGRKSARGEVATANDTHAEAAPGGEAASASRDRIASAGGLRAYLGAKGSRREIEAAVRAHGRHVAGLAEIAAERLDALTQTDADGARPTRDTLLALARRWSVEGPLAEVRRAA